MARKCHCHVEDQASGLSKYQLNHAIMGREASGVHRRDAATRLAGGGAVKVFGVNILVVLVAFVLALSGIVCAREYERSLSIDRPIEEMLQSESWVETFDLRKGDGEIVIQPLWIETLPGRLRSLLDRLSEAVGDRYSAVTVADRRTERLEQLYYHVHLVVHQALSTGDFVSMEQQLNAFARSEGLDCVRVWVSGSSAAVLLSDGDSFMYEPIGDRETADLSLTVRFEGR